MSHITKLKLVIKDLSLLDRACKRLNIQLMKNQKTFAWYGREPAPCEHAIKIPGAKYEVGVIKNGKSWELQCDWFDHGIERAIGREGGFLKREYVAEASKLDSLKKGFQVKETRLADGKVEVIITVQA